MIILVDAEKALDRIHYPVIVKYLKKWVYMKAPQPNEAIHM